jgi:hypothetical protein
LGEPFILIVLVYYSIYTRHLLIRDFNVPWLGTNAHFVFGMLGFAYMLGCRTYLRYDGGRMGTGIAGLAVSGLLLMISIVNRGVSNGSGTGLRYGRHIGYLFGNYLRMLFRQSLSPRSFGPLELGSIIVATGSLIMAASAVEKRSHHLSKDPTTHEAEVD